MRMHPVDLTNVWLVQSNTHRAGISSAQDAFFSRFFYQVVRRRWYAGPRCPSFSGLIE